MNRPVTLRTLLLTNSLTVLAIIAVLLTTTTLAGSLAQTPPAPTAPTLPYQGYLTAPDGMPINATLPMTFKLYAAPTEGEALWTEARTSANAVPVTDGLPAILWGTPRQARLILYQPSGLPGLRWRSCLTTT